MFFLCKILFNLWTGRSNRPCHCVVVLAMMLKIRLYIILSLLCMTAQGVWADDGDDAWDKDNYKPYNTEVVLEKTNLPIVFVNTRDVDGNITAIHKAHRVAVRMKIIDNTDGLNYGDTIAYPGQRADYEGWVGIKYRGSSSFSQSDKKPYGFRTLKTSDVNGEKDEVELLGMPKDNNWVLLAPYHDRSLIRDPLVYQLARPYFEFTPKCKFCELILDGTYYGVYILCEKPGKGENRLNLTDAGESGDELTGDYMVCIDREDEPHFALKYDMLGHEVDAQYSFPAPDDMTNAQKDYIKHRFDEMEDALYGDHFTDEEDGYRKYIYVGSFVDYQLTTEWCLNPDGYRLSTYIYKRRDSVDPRFKVCPWDYNMTFGNNIAEALLHNEWMYKKGKILSVQMNKAPVPFWWDRLTEDEAYWNGMKERWAEYRTSNYSDEHIAETIDSLLNELNVEGACDRNYEAWPIWDKEIPLAPTVATNYDEEIEMLRAWIADRLTWMDKQLGFATDGIKEIGNERNGADDGWYDLMGRKLANGQKSKAKGIYIHQGNKKIIK